MAMMMVPDNEKGRDLEALAPHKNMYDPNKPRSLTAVATIPKPPACTFSHWITYPREAPPGPEKIAFLRSLAIA